MADIDKYLPSSSVKTASAPISGTLVPTVLDGTLLTITPTATQKVVITLLHPEVDGNKWPVDIYADDVEVGSWDMFVDGNLNLGNDNIGGTTSHDRGGNIPYVSGWGEQVKLKNGTMPITPNDVYFRYTILEKD